MIGTGTRIGILTSGGDAPGMNAAIRAATLLARDAGLDVVGIRHGYRGLVAGDVVPLDAADVAGILRDGGTILGSARCPAFLERKTRDQARRRLREAGVGALVVIGGNGSLTGAAALSDPAEAGDDPLRVVGVPASIDNDIGLTGMAIGVDTAMNTIVEACDKLSDTAAAHDRTFLVEVMGRSCGYLAMTAGLAAGADAVLVPEAGRGDDEIIDGVVHAIRRVRAREHRPKRVLVIKAEGVAIATEALKTAVDRRLAEDSGRDPETVETRVTVLGHVVRGGRPTAFDRLLASRLAVTAVRALLDGRTRVMAAWLQPSTAPGTTTADDPYCRLVDLADVLAETERMLEGSSDLVRWRAQALARIEPLLLL